MVFIDSKTGKYPIFYFDLLTEFPNTSFPVGDFDPPYPYKRVALVDKPDFNEVYQKVVENIPIKENGTYKQSWSVVSRFENYTDDQGVVVTAADQEAAAIAADQAAKVKALQDSLVAAIQTRLDDFARTRNYDGILSLCTYATSTVLKFKTEGQYGVDARDSTWARLYEIMTEAEAGTRPVPTGFADIEPDLPTLAWPA